MTAVAPGPTFSVDRPVFMAIAISMNTGKAYLIPGITNLSISKDTSGDPGQFNFTCPARNPYDQAVNQPLLAYAAVAGPMDIIAIYGARTSVTDTDQTPALTFGPLNAGNINTLTYGSPAATVTQQLASASCLFIGMVDDARMRGVVTQDSPTATFYVSGRDLTKIFYENDTNVIPTQAAAFADPGTSDQVAIPVLVAVEAYGSSTQVLLTILDLTVAKNVSPSTASLIAGDTDAVAALNSPAFQQLGQYGYPWRNFIVVMPPYVDLTYTPLGAGKYPPISIQQGAAWANAIELRNAPVSRMYVDEIGHLVYGDQLSAWTQAAVVGQIPSTDIGDWDIGLNDNELITALAVYPLSAQGGQGQNTLSGIKGVGASVGFVDGLQANTTSTEAIQKFGNRWQRFDSLWDISQDQCAFRRKVVVEECNSLFRGEISVRGSSKYRVGSRWVVNLPAHRPEVQNATWYIDGIEHAYTFGEEWTTTLKIRFPQTPDGAYH